MGTDLKNVLEESKKIISSKISVYETMQNVKFSTTTKKRRKLKRRSLTKMKILNRRLRLFTKKLSNANRSSVAKIQEATQKLQDFFKKAALN